MSNYTKSTNFATKDALSSGNALKIVKGTEIDTEFNNIQTAIATKSDSASPTFTGTVVIPTATITTATIGTANISAGTITGITDLAVADGGTGASTAANARTNLGLVIGTNVQAWDADLDTWATKTAPSGTVVGESDTQTLTNKTLTSPIIGGTPTGVGVLTSGTAVTCAGQTSIDFTSIPSWVKKITVMLNGVSTSGTSSILVQLGDSGGIENTGYTGVAVRSGSSTNAYELSTAGFPLNESNTASLTYQSLVTLALLDASTNTWVISGTASTYASNNLSALSGGKSLSATLDRVRITTVNGTDTFDTTPSAGIINILYE
jgi:hypothetical protein